MLGRAVNLKKKKNAVAEKTISQASHLERCICCGHGAGTEHTAAKPALWWARARVWEESTMKSLRAASLRLLVNLSPRACFSICKTEFISPTSPAVVWGLNEITYGNCPAERAGWGLDLSWTVWEAICSVFPIANRGWTFVERVNKKWGKLLTEISCSFPDTDPKISPAYFMLFAKQKTSIMIT